MFKRVVGGGRGGAGEGSEGAVKTPLESGATVVLPVPNMGFSAVSTSAWNRGKLLVW